MQSDDMRREAAPKAGEEYIRIKCGQLEVVPFGLSGLRVLVNGAWLEGVQSLSISFDFREGIKPRVQLGFMNKPPTLEQVESHFRAAQSEPAPDEERCGVNVWDSVKPVGGPCCLRAGHSGRHRLSGD